MAKIPARYVGGQTVLLRPFQGPFFDADGKQLETLRLHTGDTLMMGDREVLGQTLLFDPAGQHDPVDLGVGRVVRAEHAGKSDEELLVLGYEFTEGRPDFQPLIVPEGVVPLRQVAAPAPGTLHQEAATEVIAAEPPQARASASRRQVALPAPAPAPVAASATAPEGASSMEA